MRARGFTFIELIVVIILVGIIAAVAVPKLMSENAMTPVALRDEVSSGLRYALKTAVGHRRLVCASKSGNNIALQIASAAGAITCNTDLVLAITGSSNVNYSNLIVAPALLYFQPDGTITSDGAGSATKSGAITITNAAGTETYTVNIDGVTGYVD
jgi:MSHA pilin protein MshC